LNKIRKGERKGAVDAKVLESARGTIEKFHYIGALQPFFVFCGWLNHSADLFQQFCFEDFQVFAGQNV
jgi:hypothetical protein